MLKVERLPPSEVPGRDMFFPQIIADPEGFYIGMDLDGLSPGTMRACVSVKGIRELAAREGMVDPAELQAENERLHARVTELEDELKEADRFRENVDGVLKPGYVIRKAPGRKPKKQEVEA